MKKYMLVCGVFSLLLFVSCKKDWNCTCTTTVVGYPSVSGDTVLVNLNKEDAQTHCNALESSGPNWDSTCDLK